MIERLKKFGLDFEHTSMTPFFQVQESHRIRFGSEKFDYSNIKLLHEILFRVLEQNETIDVSFIIGNKFDENEKIRYKKTNLGKFFTIKNWKETVIWNDDLECYLVFATVKNLNKEEIINYCKKVISGFTQAYIMFYNDSNLVYINSDVLDIISINSEYIADLEKAYDDIFDTEYKS